MMPLAWVLQAMLVAAFSALLFGKFCLGAYVYHLLKAGRPSRTRPCPGPERRRLTARSPIMGRSMPQETVAHYRLRSGSAPARWRGLAGRGHAPPPARRPEDAPPERRCRRRGVARLLREARVAASLSHPNVAVVYEVASEGDAGEAGYVAWIREGRTLAELVERADGADLHPPIARQVAEALAEPTSTASCTGTSNPATDGERRAREVLDFDSPASPAATRTPPPGAGTTARSRCHRGDARLHVAEQARGTRWTPAATSSRSGAALRAPRRPASLRGTNAVRARRGDPHEEPAPRREGPSPRASSSSSPGCSRRTGPAPRRMRDVLRDLDSSSRERPASPGARPHRRVAGFANVTGAGGSWLGTGLAETVSAGLARCRLAVVSRERILEVLREMGLRWTRTTRPRVRVGREWVPTAS